MVTPTFIWSRHSPVGIATGYGLDGLRIGVRLPTGAGEFYLNRNIQTDPGGERRILASDGYRELFILE
jgi:hypothetical protein